MTPGISRNQPSARSMPSFSSSCVMISMSQPTSLRRQAHVLAAAADRQRQLIFLDEHDGPAQPRVEEHFLDLRRLQRVGDQTCSESFQRTMSMRSPPSSSTMFLMRLPRTPTQAPTQSTFMSMLDTAILVR